MNIGSQWHPTLLAIVFNVLQNMAEIVEKFLVSKHPVSLAEATFTVTALEIKLVYLLKGATHFRIQNHLSIISDFSYDEGNRRYEPFGYSGDTVSSSI